MVGFFMKKDIAELIEKLESEETDTVNARLKQRTV